MTDQIHSMDEILELGNAIVKDINVKDMIEEAVQKALEEAFQIAKAECTHLCHFQICDAIRIAEKIKRLRETYHNL